MPNGKRCVRVRLKGINTIRYLDANGEEVVYRYYRATGQKLEGEPGTPEFLQSYAAAERVSKDRGKGTFSDLIRRFEDSDAYDDMAATTKAEYKRKFRKIDKDWGSAPIAGLTDIEFRKDVLLWRDKIARHTRREADNLVSAMARVLAFAVDRAEIDVNVLDKVRRTYRSDRSEKIWMPEHVAAFTKVASPELCQALMLAMNTGQRQSDLLMLPWSAYDGERISLRQRKTMRKGKGGVVVSIRCTAALKRMLDGMPKRGPLILSTKTGRAFTKRYFAECWQEASEAAGIRDLHFHDLRGTAVTMLAEAGCSVPEIAAITGHTLAHAQQILDVYLARTRQLADAAIFKLEQHARFLQKTP